MWKGERINPFLRPNFDQIPFPNLLFVHIADPIPVRPKSYFPVKKIGETQFLFYTFKTPLLGQPKRNIVLMYQRKTTDAYQENK